MVPPKTGEPGLSSCSSFPGERNPFQLGCPLWVLYSGSLVGEMLQGNEAALSFSFNDSQFGLFHCVVDVFLSELLHSPRTVIEG